MTKIIMLPVENEDQDSSHSGDAIIIQIDQPGTSRPLIAVLDAGFSDTGEEVVEALQQHFGTTDIDLVISSHPDTDHINGLQTVLERCRVGQLWLHQPWKHHPKANQLSNYERIVDLYATAVANDVTVVEPFAGLSFSGVLTVLGPSEAFYEQQLADAIADVTAAGSLFGSMRKAAGLLVRQAKLAFYPPETLTNTDDTSARNNTSAVVLLQQNNQRFLFTGDAGIGALDQAADQYESRVGTFSSFPLTVLQAPHHGSHHNLGPILLDRLVGSSSSGSGSDKPIAMISSAKSSEKHPSTRVTNALGRRGVSSYTTEGVALGWGVTGWTPAVAVPPMTEED